jgi:hypothetical protein
VLRIALAYKGALAMKVRKDVVLQIDKILHELMKNSKINEDDLRIIISDFTRPVSGETLDFKSFDYVKIYHMDFKSIKFTLECLLRKEINPTDIQAVMRRLWLIKAELECQAE